MPAFGLRPSRAAFTAALLALLACNRGEEPKRDRSPPLTFEEVPSASVDDVREVETSAYARSLADQLDLVPAGASFLVIRDLRPILAQARQIERVLSGPVLRAIPGMAKAAGAGAGDGQALIDSVQQAHSTLALVLAGLESSGVTLGRGAVVTEVEGEPVVLFSAPDLQQLGLLATLAGDASFELAKHCKGLADQPTWWVCSLGKPEVLTSYRPSLAGAQRVTELQARVPGVALEPINAAMMLEGESAQTVVLRTDPGLWEASMPMPSSGEPGQELFETGPSPALRSLVPATGFIWLRFDREAMFGGPEATALASSGLSPELLSGELFIGVVDAPAAIVSAFGITDASEAARGVQKLGQMLPAGPIEPDELPGTKVAIDRSPIELDGKLVPSVRFDLSGEFAGNWTQTLGLPASASMWAYGDYLTVALGGDPQLPIALGRLRGEGPSPDAVANLPPTMARALLEREVGLAVHVVLDHWQAPLSEKELVDLFGALREENRPDPAAVGQAFATLAPWSTMSVWLQRSGSEGSWMLHASLVPFGAPGAGIEQAEVEAATAALDTVLSGGDAAAAYRGLLERFSGSPRAAAYRARAGGAAEHHAAIGLLQLGAFAAIAVPALQGFMKQARVNEATANTQAILSAALAVREREGSCAKLIGSAGPTPGLSVACHAARGGRCQPVVGTASEPGHYDGSVWTTDPIWSVIGWSPDAGHRFHYSFEGSAEGSSCTLIVRAQADLDGNQIFSSYTRSTTIAADGSQQSPGLAVENELE